MARAQQSRAIRFNEHLTGGGPTIFKHFCQMGLEGYRVEADGGGLSKTWLKSKNSASEAVRRERVEDGVSLGAPRPS